MDSLLADVRVLEKGDVGKLVEKRMREFEANGRRRGCGVFNEMCFCILTANYTAERAIMIQKCVGDGFTSMSEKRLAATLKKLGHRFPNARAGYIVEARKHEPLTKTIKSFDDEMELRLWFVDNVKGLGMKEASHFLRNIGFKNLAIIDFHIVDILVRNALIERPKMLSKKRYLEVEQVLRSLADKLAMNLAELDLYLWYLETGKILK